MAEDIRFELDGAAVLLSRGLALGWERRADLQHHFPLRDLGSLNAYVSRCLTDGLHEGSVAPDIISDGLVTWLIEVAPDAGPARGRRAVDAGADADPGLRAKAGGEHYVPSAYAADQPEYALLGITDAAILCTLGQDTYLLTADFALYLAALSRHCDAENFANLR